MNHHVVAVLANSAGEINSAVLGALGVALAGGIVAGVTAFVNRKSNHETSAGTLASGAADLIEQSLSLIHTTNETASKMAAALEAERDACHADRLVLLSVVEGSPIDPDELSALRARIKVA